MKIITSNEEFFRFIRLLAKRKGAEVRIASYNLFTGVLDDGRYTNDWSNVKWHNDVGELFDLLYKNGVKVEVKIGKPLFKSCKMQDNPLCALHRQEEKWDGRVSQMDKRWPTFTFHILALSHAKLILIDHKNGNVFSIYGGRNLTDAPLADVSFIDADPEIYSKLLKVYQELK